MSAAEQIMISYDYWISLEMKQKGTAHCTVPYNNIYK